MEPIYYAVAILVLMLLCLAAYLVGYSNGREEGWNSAQDYLIGGPED